MRISQIVRLMPADEFTLVVPPVDRREPKVAVPRRKLLLAGFCRILLRAEPSSSTFSQELRESFLQNELDGRAIVRGGKTHYEFDVRISSYPERPMIAQCNPLGIDVNHWLGRGNAGFRLEVLGYGTSTTTLLRLSDLPYVEVFAEREVDGAFLDPSLEFCTIWGGEELLAKKVSREMHATKGDAVAYTQILLNHYKVSAMHAQKKLDVNAALDVNVLLHNKVKAELEHSRIENYAVAIGAAYKAAMEQRFSDFCVPLAFLMSHDDSMMS